MISSVITTYKREPNMVLRALDSIIHQTYRDIEIIVVDDSPNSYELRQEVKEAVLKRNEENPDISIKYIAHEKNMGGNAARNTGLKAAQGEYIAYLDDDDEWMPEKLEKQIKVLQDSNVALVYCRSRIMKDDTGEITEREEKVFKGKVLKELLHRNFIGSTSYPLIRKACLETVGGFDPLMQSVQDYDVWLRLAEKYEIDFVNEPLVLYHIHGEERISTNINKRIKGTERLYKKFEKYFLEDRDLWHEWQLVFARKYAASGDIKKAIVLWGKCIKKCPGKVMLNIRYFYLIIRSFLSRSL